MVERICFTMITNNTHQNSNLTFSKEISSLLASLNESSSSENVKCLDKYIANYLDNISDKLYELYNFKSENMHKLNGSEGVSKKKSKRKIKIEDLKFIFRNDSEKLSRLTELSDLAVQRDILQKQINAPESFSILGSYGDGSGEVIGNSKDKLSKKTKKKKLNESDDELGQDVDLFQDEDEEEEEEDDDHDLKGFHDSVENIKENDKSKGKNGKKSDKKSTPKTKTKSSSTKKAKV